jgi:hypothetical protein
MFEQRSEFSFLQTLHTSSLDLGTYKIFYGSLKFGRMPEYEAQT